MPPDFATVEAGPQPKESKVESPEDDDHLPAYSLDDPVLGRVDSLSNSNSNNDESIPRRLSDAASVAPQVPLVSSVQKIILYETKSRFFLIGTNNLENKYRVLKVDRTDAKELIIHDDGVTYTQRQIKQMLQMIDIGNRSKQAAQKNVAGMTKTLSAFGIVGFVRFLEGYHMILITKRRKVGLIGHHTIYKVEDVAMVYIPNDSVRKHDAEEGRFVKIFQSVDLSSNFYFSYSYDLTHSLQYNMTRVSVVTPSIDRKSEEPPVSPGTRDQSDDDSGVFERRDGAQNSKREGASKLDGAFSTDNAQHKQRTKEQQTKNTVVGVRTLPHHKFVWNEFLLADFETRVHSSWVLHLIHGFVSQGDLEVFGKSIFITLIARRSKKFAGTRFLKRGANSEGDVANEVETEQIVHLAEAQDWNHGSFTSFVQMRGSIPLSWSQEVRQIVPKPPITMGNVDPFCRVPGEHFNKLLKRFGSPIIVFNLIKKKERRIHESQLGAEFEVAIRYLNQFLPHKHQLEYLHFDMARVSRSRTAVVMDRLMGIADASVKKTGFFQNFPDKHCHTLRPDRTFEVMARGFPAGNGRGRIQTGIVRTNCVDCLDRTNTAQFAIGKKALAYQLFSLGILESPNLLFESDCVRMLEGLFEDHGDTLALQYGGSQLVHRIRSYRRVSPWLQSKSNDFFQSVSRYYSNTFSDADKQQAINLFLGIFQPRDFRVRYSQFATSWDLDYYLHHSSVRRPPRRRFYTQWWELSVWRSLPRAAEEDAKDQDVMVAIECSNKDERVDGYSEYYQPQVLTSLDDLYCSNMINSMRDYTPSFAKNISPFAVRDRSSRATDRADSNAPDQTGYPSSSLKVVSTGLPASTGTMNQRPGDSMDDSRSVKGGQSSAEGSEDSQGSDSESDSDLDSLSDLAELASPKQPPPITMAQMFPSMQDTYGTVIHSPKANDINMYKQFSTIGRNAGCGLTRPDARSDQNRAEAESPKKRLMAAEQMMQSTTVLIQRSVFSLDTSRQVMPPTVKRANRDVYEKYVARAKGPQEPSAEAKKKYQDYVSMLYK